MKPAETKNKEISGRLLLLVNLNPENSPSRVLTVFILLGKSWIQLCQGSPETWDDEGYLANRIKHHPLL
jgi:hypothetical protein